ncbi:hypothetical protein [Rugamonas rubra]|uniref:hypothetical protein n=1 Tax=Rugamonas rubra TaxID=758825 RepID=UPI001113EC27|nr:hypothetical protein [Rugamonas rubra]
MQTLVRYLLWMLIAALPLQGTAAAFMSGAGMDRDSAARAGAEMVAAVMAATMPATASAAQTGMADELVAMHAAHCGEAMPEHGKATHGKCSSCASCCVGVCAPPQAVVLFFALPLARCAVLVAEPAMTAFIPATLERPPRLIS